MNKDQLKKVLKPLVKQCVKEALYEDGILSSVISEVVKGLGSQQLVQETKTRSPEPDFQNERLVEQRQRAQKAISQRKRKLLDAIGKDAYNGVDIFKDTSPMVSESKVSAGDPLAGQDPGDAGVDISGIFSLGGKNWKSLMK